MGNVGILPSGGVALGRVCACSLPSRPVNSSINIIYNNKKLQFLIVHENKIISSGALRIFGVVYDPAEGVKAKS